MARYTRQTAVAAALLAALFAGGCATTVAGTPSADPRPQPSSGPGADPTAWADRVCGGLITYLRPEGTASKPDFKEFGDQSGLSPEQRSTGIKTQFSEFLGAVSTSIDQAQEQLRAAGPSPVSGGDGYVRAWADVMPRNKQIVVETRAEVDKVDPANLEALQRVLETTVPQKLGTFVKPQGLDQLGNTPRLVKAIEAAPKCAEVRSLSQPPPP